MAWEDNLLDASFDGIPFLYKRSRTRVGRRIQVHEFAKRDDPFAEDLGKKARRYVLECFIIGDNYAAGRDAMMEAIEIGGDHIITHPYLGDFVVKVENE